MACAARVVSQQVNGTICNLLQSPRLRAVESDGPVSGIRVSCSFFDLHGC